MLKNGVPSPGAETGRITTAGFLSFPLKLLMGKIRNSVLFVVIFLYASCHSLPGGNEESKPDDGLSSGSVTRTAEGNLHDKETEGGKAGDGENPGDVAAGGGRGAEQDAVTDAGGENKFHLQRALDEISVFFKPPVFPLSRGKRWLRLLFDLDADGWPEIFIPALEGESARSAEFEYLSDFSRLYDPGEKPQRFFLYVFSYYQKKYVCVKRLDCGTHFLFKSFSHFLGNSETGNPFVLELTFQTGEGLLRKWIVFDKPHLSPSSILEIRETLLKKTIIEDIDGNGQLDVILLETSAEEKIGNETYLTWLKWDGRTFREHGNTNIVRNLNAFLREVKALFLAGEPEMLLSYAVDGTRLEDARRRGESDKEILFTYLGLPPAGSDGLFHNMLDGVTGVVFPDIMDNPFLRKDEYGYYFPLNYRIDYEDGLFLISRVNLYMLANPFRERQFSFLPLRQGE